MVERDPDFNAYIDISVGSEDTVSLCTLCLKKTSPTFSIVTSRKVIRF